MLVPNGKEFLLWFEPERAMRETDWVEEHMDYMLYGPGAAFYLYDLSNDEAADYLDRIHGRQDQGIRHDLVQAGLQLRTVYPLDQ